MLSLIFSVWLLTIVSALAWQAYIEKRKEEKELEKRLLVSWKKFTKEVYEKRKEMIREIQEIIEKQTLITNSFFIMKHLLDYDRIMLNWNNLISIFIKRSWELVKLEFDWEFFEKDHLSYWEMFKELDFQKTIDKVMKNIQDTNNLEEIKKIESKIDKLKYSNWKWEFVQTFKDAKRLEEIHKEANLIRERYKWDFYENVVNYIEDKWNK